MSDAKGQTEPTMEEILASIRHTISENEEAVEEGEVEDVLVLEDIIEEEPEEEVLELTEVLEDEELEPLVLKDLIEEELDSKLDLKALLEYQTEPIAEPPTYVSGPAVMSSSDSEGLASHEAGAETAEAFGNFMSAVSGTQRVQLGASDRTLEDLVKELLRPMLKDWLNNNLQSIVSRTIEREIEKLAGRVDDD